MRKSITIATLISLTASMSLAYPALAQSGAQESQSVTSFQAQTSYDESHATQITLADQTATVTGQGASFSDQTVTITQAGTYVLTGSGKNIKLVVEAADTDQVHLVFQSLTLEGEGTLLQVNKAQEVVISLVEGSQNALTESQASDDDEEVKATIHSQVPLTLNGTGNLTLTALTKNALEVEDDLKVLGGTYTVKAANHGFKAEGALDIEAATLTIEAGKDGLLAEHDETTERANISLNPTQLSIAATEDGVDAGNELTIKGGTITVSQSEEGLEARVIRQLGGDVTIKSSDDGVNASAGSSSKTTDTSATSKTTDASATSNTADTSSSAGHATTDSGTTSSSASQATADPAATSQADQANKDKNATPPSPPAGQAPPQGGQPPQNGQGPGGMPPGGQEESDPSLQIILEGGTLTIDAEGDGIDSNGTVSISGGSLVVNGSVQGGNGPLDAAGDITITGGTVWALGTSDMLQGFAQGSTQASITANIAGTAGQTLIILDANGKEVTRQTASKDFQAVIMSSADLVDGQTYTIQVEGTIQTATAALVTPVTGGFHP